MTTEINTAELRELAEASEPIDTDLYGDRYMQGPYSQANLTRDQDSFVTRVTPATMLALLDRLEEAEHQRKMLMQAIADAALKGKVWNGEVPLDGPQLLMMCDDLADVALAAQQVEAEPVGWVSSQLLRLFTTPENCCGRMTITLRRGEMVNPSDVPLYAVQPPAPAAVPEGYALVPLKLTEQMRWQMSGELPLHGGRLDAAYEAAIAAAQAGKENDRG